MATAAGATERRDALVERLFMDAIGAFDLFSAYVGDVLGLYRALADKGPLTSAELAEHAGIHERYARRSTATVATRTRSAPSSLPTITTRHAKWSRSSGVKERLGGRCTAQEISFRRLTVT
jgi:hypothetical protein